jgi:hypothetical protein
MLLIVLGVLLQAAAPTPVLENEYVRVTENAAPCATTSTACQDRVIVALGEVELRRQAGRRVMHRGDITVFKRGESYVALTGGRYLEVVLKPDRPAVKTPGEVIPPEKNAMLYEADRFFIFEERLQPGDTRPRHTHNQRVVIQLNATQLRQKADGQAEVLADIVPDVPRFNPPVIHVSTNVGKLPLRGIIIELKP